MAQLSVRQIRPRDLPAVRRDHRHCAYVAMPEIQATAVGMFDVALLATNLRRRAGTQAFVAYVDSAMSGYVVVRQDRGSFAWYVIELGGSAETIARHGLDVDDVWMVLLEYAIARAGESGAKRLFAECHEGTHAQASLRRAGFDAFTKRYVERGSHDAGLRELLVGVRPQEPSDVWSIHHLYHRLTPRPVQFAEARTSATWELPRLGRLERLPVGHRARFAFVVEGVSGIEGYCRMLRTDEGWLLTLMVDPESGPQPGMFVRTCARLVGLSAGDAMYCLVPGYAQEMGSALERDGFTSVDERISMVRHTTAPAAVHTRAASLAPAEAHERAVRGVPTYTTWLDG